MYISAEGFSPKVLMTSVLQIFPNKNPPSPKLPIMNFFD